MSINGDGKSAGLRESFACAESELDSTGTGVELANMGARKVAKLDGESGEVGREAEVLGTLEASNLGVEVDLSKWEMVKDTGGECKNEKPPTPPTVLEFFKDLLGLGEGEES
ncbi:MAG: hypothetical protein KR126chlam3_01260 [Chlamydiae bacterium]|nr:hypothetical protein [Chlamydiota bacterium]